LDHNLVERQQFLLEWLHLELWAPEQPVPLARPVEPERLVL
jgi:hypothetical protein